MTERAQDETVWNVCHSPYVHDSIPASSLEHVRRLPYTGPVKRLLRLDLVVPQRLELALVVIVGNLLVLRNDLIHIHLAARGDIVW
jgi:hypothetical protein